MVVGLLVVVELWQSDSFGRELTIRPSFAQVMGRLRRDDRGSRKKSFGASAQ